MPTARNNTPRRASSVADFKKKDEPIELPSGAFMRLSKKSLAGFIIAGNVPNSLMSVVAGETNKRKGRVNDEELMNNILEQPEKLAEMFGMVDSFVIAVALEPRVLPVPEDEADRDDDLLYIDEMEQEDKMYIFMRAMGGTTTLESFRGELAAGVDLVQQREDVVIPPKRSPRSKRPVS